jgi:hypothetical protein
MAQITYAAFLTWAIGFSTRLPAILQKLDAAIAQIVDLIGLATGTTPPISQAVMQPTPEEEALERQVATLVVGPTGAWDGSRLRAIWKFANDSGLLAILMSLLTKSA